MLPLTPEHKVKRDMEYIIYCDESVTDGKYYSDFFGGVLVRSGDFDEIKDTLEAKKQELNLLNEIKWSRVTENYLDKYIQMMDLFFSYVKQNRLKVRIMFKETQPGTDSKQILPALLSIRKTLLRAASP